MVPCFCLLLSSKLLRVAVVIRCDNLTFWAARVCCYEIVSFNPARRTVFSTTGDFYSCFSAVKSDDDLFLGKSNSLQEKQSLKTKRRGNV